MLPLPPLRRAHNASTGLCRIAGLVALSSLQTQSSSPLQPNEADLLSLSQLLSLPPFSSPAEVVPRLGEALAMHAVASRPLYLGPTLIPAADLQRETEVLRAQVGSGRQC